MKWRSVDEKPKIAGDYYLCYKTALNEEIRFQYSNFEEDRFSLVADILCWLDPEVPEELLKPKEPEEKPCPWCHKTKWEISQSALEPDSFWYNCRNDKCYASGPKRATKLLAEAAIFERVR